MNVPNGSGGPIQIRARFKGQLRGFTLDVQTEPFDYRRLDAVLGHLSDMGFAPDRPAVVWSTTPDGLPICPKHGAPMRRREKQGDEWHSHKLINGHGEEVYCRGYDGPDSPGYRVDLAP